MKRGGEMKKCVRWYVWAKSGVFVSCGIGMTWGIEIVRESVSKDMWWLCLLGAGSILILFMIYNVIANMEKGNGSLTDKDLESIAKKDYEAWAHNGYAL